MWYLSVFWSCLYSSKSLFWLGRNCLYLYFGGARRRFCFVVNSTRRIFWWRRERTCYGFERRGEAKSPALALLRDAGERRRVALRFVFFTTSARGLSGSGLWLFGGTWGRGQASVKIAEGKSNGK